MTKNAWPTDQLPRIRLKSGGLDARDRTGLVIVGGVAADTDRAEQNAAVLDQHAARHRHHPALRQRIHRADEIGLLLRTLEQRPRSHPQGKSAVSLAMGNLAAQQA